jgi:hypothetical protein
LNKNWQVSFLKIISVLAVVPPMFLCLYYFPKIIIEGVDLSSPYAPYMIVIMISVYFISVPYSYAFYITYKLLCLIETREFFTKKSEVYLTKINKLAYLVAVFFTIDLPFIYIMADMDDAPGLVMIGLFLTIFSLAIGVFANVLKKVVVEHNHYH